MTMTWGQRLVRGAVAATALISLGACVGSAARPAPPSASKPVVTRPAPTPARPVPSTPARPAPAAPAAIDSGFSRPPPGLDQRLFVLWRDFPGKTGIAVQRIDGDWTLARRGDDLFPQQSVSKLWVSLAALDAVDRGKVRLDDRVTITPDDLTLFYQPIATRVRAEGRVQLSIADLMLMAITESDNTANDSLARAIGGPAAVRRFLADRKLTGIRFGPGERLLQAQTAGMTWDQSYSAPNAFQAARALIPADVRANAMRAYLADPVDGASPRGIAMALTRLARGELLSGESTATMLGIMARTKSGPQRLKAGLPAGWRLAHKTGTGQDLNGMTAGYNNVGIATAPDGTRYAIVVLLADTTASVPDRMKLMQAVAAAVAEYHGK